MVSALVAERSEASIAVDMDGRERAERGVGGGEDEWAEVKRSGSGWERVKWNGERSTLACFLR